MRIFDASAPFDAAHPADAAVPLDVQPAVTPRGDEVHIRVSGELDIATHGDLLAGLSTIELGDAVVVRVDLSGLSFCDARGGCLLLRFLEHAGHSGKVVSIERPTPAVRRLLLIIDPDSSLVA